MTKPRHSRRIRSAYDLNPKDATSARNAVKAAISVARRSSSNSSKSNYYNQAGQIADQLANASPTFEHQLLAGEAWLGAKQYQKAQASFDKARASNPTTPSSTTTWPSAKPR